MNPIPIIRLLPVLAGLLAPAAWAQDLDAVPAQRAEAMRVWHNLDGGLPSDSVTAVIQTRDGFLWVGTSAGVARFDGFKFTELPLASALAAATTNQPIHITALCEDSLGYLWIGTEQDGLFELARGALRHFTRTQGLLDAGVTSLAADQRGEVWIGTPSGLNLWNGESFTAFTTRDGLPDDYVSGVNVARSGTVWITTRVGMCRFTNGRIVPYEFQTESQGRSPQYLGAYEDQRGNLWAFGDTYLINLAEGKRFNYFRSSESASVRIWSLCEGRDGRLWIGTSGRGLFCFEDNRFQPVILDEARWPYDVRAICEDTEGDLWLGTSGGGLVQLRPQSVHVLPADQGLPAGPPTALAVDAAGRVYVGLQRGGLYAGEAGRFDRVGGADDSLENFISAISVGRDGTVWAGTLGDGLYGLRDDHRLHLTTADGLADNAISAVCVDAADNVWIGTASGTVHCLAGDHLTSFTVAQGLPGTAVTAMIASPGGGLWLGTRDGLVLREKNGKFAVVATTQKNDRAVLSLYEEDDNGRLWIGTGGDGLDCLFNGTVLHWNSGNGLPGDIVAGVAEDDAQNLWLVMDTGIYRVNHRDILKFLADPQAPPACQMMSGVKTSLEDSLVSGGVRAVLSPEGELWFATSKGVLNVDTHQSEIAAPAFPFYLESAAFNNGPPVSLLRGALWSAVTTNHPPLEAPGDLRSLEIHFTAVNFADAAGIRFRHKLEGSDSDWVEADDGGARFVHYGHLPYGHYRFRVAARASNGKWQEAPAFAFVVPTPVYFQTWAICLYGLAAVGLVAGIVRVVSHRRLRFALARLEQQQALERERMRIARDMHDEMGSKLTKISFLSEHAQVEAATEPLAGKIESIARTSRELLQTMDEIVWVVNPRNDTLDNLVTYLSHYAVEYFQNTSIGCEMKLPPEIPHYPMPSEARHNLFLTFEEILNNILKHSGATSVKVQMEVRARELGITITDNGRGFAVPAWPPAGPAQNGRDGNGLKNMRQRLTDIGGECLIESRPGAGTTVALRLPLNGKIRQS